MQIYLCAVFIVTLPDYMPSSIIFYSNRTPNQLYTSLGMKRQQEIELETVTQQKKA
jgi:hypothetical protein